MSEQNKSSGIFARMGGGIKSFFKATPAQPSGLRRLMTKDGTHTVLSSIICIVLGLLIGFIVMLCINPSHVFDGGFDRILVGGMSSSRFTINLKTFGTILMNSAPLILCALAILFSYKAGLFNIGVAGQYCIGMMVSLYAAHAWGLHWSLCILLAVGAAALWAAIVGLLKALCNVNEVISGIMLNWIAVYLTNIVIKSGAPYGSEGTWMEADGGTVPVTGSSLIPDLGLSNLFNGEYVTFAIFVSVIVAVILWIVLKKTTFGYELRATGLSRDAARYAGMKTKKNFVLTLAISGAVAGLGAALCYLSNLDKYLTLTSVPSMGFDGIAVAFLGGLHPIGAVFAGFFISYISMGGAKVNTMYFDPAVADLVISAIVYLCAFVLFIKELLKRIKIFREAKKTTAGAEAPPPNIENKAEGGENK